MFNSAAHNKPSLIRDLLSQVMPYLYEETKVKKELVREVEMGPFKHTVDDGLDLRKVGKFLVFATTAANVAELFGSELSFPVTD